MFYQFLNFNTIISLDKITSIGRFYGKFNYYPDKTIFGKVKGYWLDVDAPFLKVYFGNDAYRILTANPDRFEDYLNIGKDALAESKVAVEKIMDDLELIIKEDFDNISKLLEESKLLLTENVK